MTAHIVASGETAKHWDGQGFSIGVNDAWKWGHKLNWLVCINHPSKFSNEPERMKIIKNSTPERFFSHTESWRHNFPNMQKIRLTRPYGRLRRGVYYHSSTSPFAAMSVAFNNLDNLKELVLWGVDFQNHKVFHPKSRSHRPEIDAYKRLCEGLNKHGIEIYLGAPGSALESFLKVKEWKKVYS
jgi:hypothetical protein